MRKSEKQESAIKEAYAEILAEASESVKSLLCLDIEAYEDKSNTTYIGIDDVCNKMQKANRVEQLEENTLNIKNKPVDENHSNGRKGGKKNYKKRKFLFHTVIKIVTEEGCYTLTAAKVGLIWSTLIAVLLENNLLKTQLFFLVDGQRTLHNFILARMKWSPVRLLLDWYHLRKKVHMQFYKGLKKTDQRDKIMCKVEQYLWHGLLDAAIQVIEKIPEQLVKDEKELKILIGYFERNQKLIPNYACRKKLRLVCSSNRVEKENDLIIAARQKRNGMSWSRIGSDALATITAIPQNKELDLWLKDKTISLKLAA